MGFQRHRNAAQVPSLACEVQLAGPRAGRSASPNAQVHQFALYAPPVLSLRGLVVLGPWLRLLGVLNPQSVPMNVLASTWWVCCSGGGSYSFNGKAGMRNHGSSVRNGPGLIMHWLRDWSSSRHQSANSCITDMHAMPVACRYEKTWLTAK